MENRTQPRKLLRKNMVKSMIHISAAITELQAEQLQQRVSALPFKVNYQEEEHGATLMVKIDCTPSQERTMREILHELGALPCT